jgi:hypothetical protein
MQKQLFSDIKNSRTNFSLRHYFYYLLWFFPYIRVHKYWRLFLFWISMIDFTSTSLSNYPPPKPRCFSRTSRGVWFFCTHQIPYNNQVIYWNLTVITSRAMISCTKYLWKLCFQYNFSGVISFRKYFPLSTLSSITKTAPTFFSPSSLRLHKP